MIHFTNGSNVADALRAAALPGRVAECADPLHEGPCLAGLPPDRWRATRARFLADDGGPAIDRVLADLEARDAEIAGAAAEDEVVLWFEHDLFDQLNLIWLVGALAAARVPPARVQLVVIGRHPDVPRFTGLGQLSPRQLRDLFPRRATMTEAARAEAQAAWLDVCAPDPRGLARRAQAPSDEWPWLPGALQRLVEELPDARSGLSRTERQGLEAVAAGAATLGEAFSRCADLEERVFLGDWTFYRIMRRLHAAVAPLVRTGEWPDAGPSAGAAVPVSITGLGRRVLAGEADHAAVNRLDRWVGGVHLEGSAPRWRWDPEARRVTPFV